MASCYLASGHPQPQLYIGRNFMRQNNFFFSVAFRSNAGDGLHNLQVSRSHTTTHKSRKDTSGRVISSSQGPLHDNSQHSKQTNIHASGGIRNHSLSRRVVADLRLRPRGHRDRPSKQLRAQNEVLCVKNNLKYS